MEKDIEKNPAQTPQLTKEVITAEMPSFEALCIRFFPYEYGALCVVDVPLESNSKAKSHPYVMARYWCSRDKKGDISAKRLDGMYPNTPKLVQAVESSYEGFSQNQQVNQKQ